MKENETQRRSQFDWDLLVTLRGLIRRGLLTLLKLLKEIIVVCKLKSSTFLFYHDKKMKRTQLGNINETFTCYINATMVL